MDDLDELDFEAEYDPLEDPDVYVLLRQGRVEATFLDAELQGLVMILAKAAREERARRDRQPQKGVRAAFSKALSSPAGGFTDPAFLLLKVRGVVNRMLVRQGLGPARARFRDDLGR